MSTLGNSPSAHTIIRAEARKSFSLGVYIRDSRGRPANLLGCKLRAVAKRNESDPDSANIFGGDANATITAPAEGYGVFNFQASTLNDPPGEYPFVIVLVTQQGFSSSLVKGTFELVQNAEVASVDTAFAGVNPVQTLDIVVEDQGYVVVQMGATLPPGMSYVRDETLVALESFDPESIAYMPPGGDPGYVLTKTSRDNYKARWRPVGNGAFALNANGVARGFTPTALGDGTWIWEAVGIDAEGIDEGWAPVANGDDTWSWAKVTVAKPDWNAAPGTEGEILNKPTLGSAAAKDTEDFLGADTLLSALPGVHFQTTVPTTGDEGHFYFVYTP